MHLALALLRPGRPAALLRDGDAAGHQVCHDGDALISDLASWWSWMNHLLRKNLRIDQGMRVILGKFDVMLLCHLCVCVCVCVCKPLDTRGIWERKRADFAALSVFLTIRSKNQFAANVCPIFAFQTGGLGIQLGTKSNEAT